MSSDGSDFFSFNKASKRFDDPFTLYSDQYFPDNLSSALELCRHLWYLLPKYRRASQRVVRYFITDIEVRGEGDSNNKHEFKDYLKDSFGIRSALIEAGDEERVYGNGFVYMYRPFARRLIDTRDGNLSQYDIKAIPEAFRTFNLQKMTYNVPDPRESGPLGSRKRIDLPFKDFKIKDKNQLKLRKLDPRFVAIRHCHVSGHKQVIWRFEQFLKTEIGNGKLNQVDGTPKPMLEAIKAGKDYMFHPDEVFHLCAPMISGISYYGWALPEPIANFRSIYQMQVYRKADEAVGLDYVLPFRVFTPAPGAQAGEFMNTGNMRLWNAQMKSMITKRRMDKTSIHAFPYPLNYGEYGGNGKAYAQKELIQFHSDELLESAGYPAELFKGTMQIQMVPTTLRLFENAHWHMYDSFNRLLAWLSRKIFEYTGEFENLTAGLIRPSLADNMDKQAMLFQLGMAGELPRSVYMSHAGINDPEEAMRDRIDEDLRIEKTRLKKTKQFEQELSNTITEQAAGGSDGAGPGPTPKDIEEEAAIKADEWLAIESDGERAKAMNAIKVQNFNLYSLAKQMMEEKRNQAAAEGRKNVGRQQ
jgi:hypothetical protein